jgi:hypothetical protein
MVTINRWLSPLIEPLPYLLYAVRIVHIIYLLLLFADLDDSSLLIISLLAIFIGAE